jgi:hypothetical protein
MLVRLSISQWSARKFDRKVTKKAVSEFNAKDTAGRFNKVLMTSPSLEKIQKLSAETRRDHYELTLPWFDDGSRILPSKMFFDYTQKIAKHRECFQEYVKEFIVDYPSLIESAKNFLGDMFSEDEYPDAKIIASKFDFDTFVFPIPSKYDFRVESLNGDLDKIKRDIESRVNNQVKEAAKDLWNRLYDAINTFVERLSDNNAVFRDSLIGNIQDLTGIIGKLNITNDENLTSVVDEIVNTLCGYSPESLRKIPSLRQSAADTGRKILQIIEQHRS